MPISVEPDPGKQPLSRKPARETQTRISFYTTYRQACARLEKIAGDQGVSIGKLTQACSEAAGEAEILYQAADRFLHDQPGSLAKLVRLLKNSGPSPLDELFQGKDRDSAVPAKTKTGQPQGFPTFAPGMADLYAQALRVGMRHQEVGLAMLGALCGLNRKLLPMVLIYQGMNGRRGLAGLPGSSGPDLDPDNPSIPPEFTDPFYTDPFPAFHGGAQPGEPGSGIPLAGWPSGRLDPIARQLVRCEASLLDGLQRAVDQSSRMRGGSFPPVLTILEITPNHAAFGVEPLIQIAVVADGDLFKEGELVPVSFPVRDGRQEAQGEVRSAARLNEQTCQYSIEVLPPAETIEGVVQVVGLPFECTGYNAPGTDEVVQQVLSQMQSCSGMQFSANPLVFAGCKPTLPNWLGSLPEIHFQVNDPGAGVFFDGDHWDCPQSAPDPANDPAGSVDPGGGCSLQRFSHLARLEADENLVMKVHFTNPDPAQTTLAYTKCLDASSLNSSLHLIDGILYHGPWDQAEFANPSNWQACARLEPQDETAYLVSIAESTLGRTIRNCVQLVKAETTAGAQPRRRILELYRYLKHAKIESIDVQLQANCENILSTVQIEIAMPTYAAFGVTGEVQVEINGQHVGSVSFTQHSKQKVQLQLENVDYFQIANDGHAAVSASVRYTYMPSTDFPALANQGEMTGAGLTVNKYIPPLGLYCFRTLFDPSAQGYHEANTYLLALLSLYTYPGKSNATERRRRRLLDDHFGFDNYQEFSAQRVVFTWGAVGVDPQAIVIRHPAAHIISFRGTEAFKLPFFDIWTDADYNQVLVGHYKTHLVMVHEGFWDSLAVIYEDIKARIQSQDRRLPIWLTGHSLGGAMALLCAYRLIADGFNVKGLYTYAAPISGNGGLRTFLEEKMLPNKIEQWINNLDIVPNAPPRVVVDRNSVILYTRAREVNLIKGEGCSVHFEMNSSDDVLFNYKLSDHSMLKYCKHIYAKLSADLKLLVPPPPAEE